MVTTNTSQVRSGWLREAASRLVIALGARALWAGITKLFDHTGVDL